MVHSSLRIGAAALLISYCSASALADKLECRAEIVAMGGAAIGEPRAQKKAIAAWRGQAIAKHGYFFGDPEKASGEGIKRPSCARNLVGMFVCEARGQPCSEKQADQNTETFCTRGDSELCRSNLKWVQIRLNDHGARIAVDGLWGDETEEAIRNYKRRKHIGNNSKVDDRLLESLKG